ncbi:MAG: TetR/AcrR family transcriptional regulator [Myxococcales bacterium]|nr:TetR/AcrR family transcriptional regulator [Myxococcales bacterium]
MRPNPSTATRGSKPAPASSKAGSVTTTAPLEWVRPPLQARSRETLERLLDAAEEVIEERGVEEATVAEVVRRAGSSVGSFYARFRDKEGLVRSVFERFADQALMTATDALSPERWAGVAIDQAIETLARFVIGVLEKKRGIVTALVARAPVDPTFTRFGERLIEQIGALLVGLLEARGLRANHPQPRLAVDVAVWLFLSALELRALATMHGAPRLTDADAARELARMCTRYLGVAETAIAKPGARRSRAKSSQGIRRARTRSIR